MSAYIIRHCDQMAHETVLAFGNSLPDDQLRDFEDFIQVYIPNLTFRNVTISVPPFNLKGAALWRNRISEIANHARIDKWNRIRPLVFEELNKALVSKTGIDPTLRLIQSIIGFRGCDDFEHFLPGLVLAAANDTSHVSEAILNSIVQSIPVTKVLDALHASVASEQTELSLRAIQVETKILVGWTVVGLRPCLSQITTALEPVFRSSIPELRRAAVLCFVQLYQQLGKEIMDRYLGALPKASQELVLIYCARHHIE
jgi:hypothetical protein